jgi:hypothetical protein
MVTTSTFRGRLRRVVSRGKEAESVIRCGGTCLDRASIDMKQLFGAMVCTRWVGRRKLRDRFRIGSRPHELVCSAIIVIHQPTRIFRRGLDHQDPTGVAAPIHSALETVGSAFRPGLQLVRHDGRAIR